MDSPYLWTYAKFKKINNRIRIHKYFIYNLASSFKSRQERRSSELKYIFKIESYIKALNRDKRLLIEYSFHREGALTTNHNNIPRKIPPFFVYLFLKIDTGVSKNSDMKMERQLLQ